MKKESKSFCKVTLSSILWQSSRPDSFSPAGLTLWPSWLERWLATLSGLSVQVRIPVGLPGHYIGGSSAGLGKAQRIDRSLRADWFSCFSLAWWEWGVARQVSGDIEEGRNVTIQPTARFSPAGLTLWPSWLERWLATLSGLSVQVRIPVGLPGHYNTMDRSINPTVNHKQAARCRYVDRLSTAGRSFIRKNE